MIRSLVYEDNEPFLKVEITAFKNDPIVKDNVTIKIICHEGVYLYVWTEKAPVVPILHWIELAEIYGGAPARIVRISGHNTTFYANYGTDKVTAYAFPPTAEWGISRIYHEVW